MLSRSSSLPVTKLQTFHWAFEITDIFLASLACVTRIDPNSCQLTKLVYSYRK